MSFNNGNYPDYDYSNMYNFDDPNYFIPDDENLYSMNRYNNMYNHNRYYNNRNRNRNNYYPGCDRNGRCDNPMWWLFWPFFFF